MHKPIPDPDDPLTRPYWQAAASDQLRIQQCQVCKRFHHPPTPICWHCHSEQLDFVPVNGRGTIYSFTIVRDQRNPAFDDLMPYPVARIELDDAPGVFIVANIVGADLADIAVDKPVDVVFETITDGVKIPQFRLRSSSRERAA